MLDEVCGGRSDVKTECRDQPVQADVIHQFAEMLSGDILDTVVGKTRIQSGKDGALIHSDKVCNISDSSEVTKWAQSNQQKLAKRLAYEIYNSALEEVARHRGLANGKSEVSSNVLPKQKDETSDLQSKPCSSMYCCDQEESGMEVDPKMEGNESSNNHDRPSDDPCFKVQCSDFTTYSNALNDMANIGSLDYPDAPPSTPLLPEMIKSRASFTRKLKGGLAKEFLPSPPPPTPKDQHAESLSEDKMTETAADKSEFMVRLMRSLSLACSQHGDLDEQQDGIGPEDQGQAQNGISTLSDYAAWLSADIVSCITTAQPSSDINRETPVRSVQLLADHLAEEIIIMSVAEGMRSTRVDRKRQQSSHMSSSMASCLGASTEKTARALGDTLLPDPDISDIETLSALAGRLIGSTLVQAFSELEKGALGQVTSKEIPGEISEPPSSDGGRIKEHIMCLNTTKTKQTTTTECYNGKTSHNCTMADSTTETPLAEHLFAEKIVQEVLKFSMRESSNFLLSCNTLTVDSDRHTSSAASPRGAGQTVLRGFISDELCQNIQELQCVLLWAAVSHAGTSLLLLDVADDHIRQQVWNISALIPRLLEM